MWNHLRNHDPGRLPGQGNTVHPWDLVSETSKKSYIAAVNPPRNCVLISHIVAHAFLLTDLRITWYAYKRTLYEAREHAWHCQCNCLS